MNHKKRRIEVSQTGHEQTSKENDEKMYIKRNYTWSKNKLGTWFGLM